MVKADTNIIIRSLLLINNVKHNYTYYYQLSITLLLIFEKIKLKMTKFNCQVQTIIYQVCQKYQKKNYIFQYFILQLYQEIEVMSEVCLPENYAQKMFQLEATLEYQGTIDLIRELNDHYRAGIDYYAQKEPRRAIHLQKKMTSLLASPDNIRILEREARKNHTKNQTDNKIQKIVTPGQKIEIHPSLNTRKLKQEVTKFHTVADTCIQNIVENSNKMADKIQKLRKKDLNKQEEQLNDRIMLKRMKSQQKMSKIKSISQLPPVLVTSSHESQKCENMEPNPLQRLIQ